MKVIWSPLARKLYERKSEWYLRFKGADFERTFTKSIFSTVDTLAQMPTIGRIEREGKNVTLRSFLAHPGCRIFYSHSKTTVRIQRLHFSVMRMPPAPYPRN